VAAGIQKIGVNVASPLRLTTAAAVGITLEVPIFIAITFVFAPVGFFGAVLKAWFQKVNPQKIRCHGANSIPNRPRWALRRHAAAASPSLPIRKLLS
jgi:hypothetical protein